MPFNISCGEKMRGGGPGWNDLDHDGESWGLDVDARVPTGFRICAPRPRWALKA
jgi:hypothetical protein